MEYLNFNIYPSRSKEKDTDADFYGQFRDKTSGKKITIAWLRKASSEYGDYYKASISKEKFDEALELQKGSQEPF